MRYRRNSSIEPVSLRAILCAILTLQKPVYSFRKYLTNITPDSDALIVQHRQTNAALKSRIRQEGGRDAKNMWAGRISPLHRPIFSSLPPSSAQTVLTFISGEKQTSAWLTLTTHNTKNFRAVIPVFTGMSAQPPLGGRI